MTDNAQPTRSALLTSEDWWAIWIGAFLIALTVAGLVTGVAGLGQWTANPVDAIDGRLFPLAVLGIGFALMTAIPAVFMGGSLVLHQAGFIPLFLLAAVAYFLSLIHI